MLVGCSKSGPAPGDPAASHVRVLIRLYNKAAADLGHPPKDEQEFKQAIAASEIDPAALKLANFDEAFTSERDGQPLVVVYGDPPAGSDVIVYEQTGVDGKRLVARRVGQVEEADATRFQELVPTPAK
jgi:hypothetical protein